VSGHEGSFALEAPTVAIVAQQVPCCPKTRPTRNIRDCSAELCSIATPDTILGWYRQLIANRYDGSAKNPRGRPPKAEDIRELIVRMAKENSGWGYTRIVGAMKNLGHDVGRMTVARVLAEHGIDPAPERSKGMSWGEFLRTHWDGIAATDFFTVEVLTLLGLTRYHVLFVIELKSRVVHIAGIAHGTLSGAKAGLTGARYGCGTAAALEHVASIPAGYGRSRRRDDRGDGAAAVRLRMLIVLLWRHAWHRPIHDPGREAAAQSVAKVARGRTPHRPFRLRILLCMELFMARTTALPVLFRALLALVLTLACVHIRASRADAQAFALAARTDCPRGSADCNQVASDLTGQLDYLTLARDFARYPFHIRSNMWGPYVDDDDGAHGNTAHPQGLVQTNNVGGSWYYAISYSEAAGNGSISFASRRPGGEKWIEYIFERPVEHPSSLAQIGKYVLWVESKRLHVMDTTKLREYAGVAAPAIIAPNRYAKNVPSVTDSAGRLGTGGGGLAITQLSGGEYLLAAGIAGSDVGGVKVTFYRLQGSLDSPSRMVLKHVANVDFSCDSGVSTCTYNRNGFATHPRDSRGVALMPARDENLSFVADNRGRIFLYLPARTGSGGNRFYFYQITGSIVAGTRPSLIATATHAVPTSDVPCWYQGGTSARVDGDGVMQILCGANDFSRDDLSDLRMYFWMHPCEGSYRTWGDPNVVCSLP